MSNPSAPKEGGWEDLMVIITRYTHMYIHTVYKVLSPPLFRRKTFTNLELVLGARESKSFEFIEIINYILHHGLEYLQVAQPRDLSLSLSRSPWRRALA